MMGHYNCHHMVQSLGLQKGDTSTSMSCKSSARLQALVVPARVPGLAGLVGLDQHEDLG